jgi:hypothetical protein
MDNIDDLNLTNNYVTDSAFIENICKMMNDTKLEGDDLEAVNNIKNYVASLYIKPTHVVNLLLFKGDNLPDALLPSNINMAKINVFAQYTPMDAAKLDSQHNAKNPYVQFGYSIQNLLNISIDTLSQYSLYKLTINDNDTNTIQYIHPDDTTLYNNIIALHDNVTLKDNFDILSPFINKFILQINLTNNIN